MSVIKGVSLPQTEIARYERKLANDLIALFKVMRDEMIDLLALADREGWDEDRFIGEALKLVEGAGE